MLVDARSATALIVDDHRVGGGQGGAGHPVVMAAQQQINRMRATRARRDKDSHYRPGGTAAGPIAQSRPPGTVSPVIRGRSGSLATGGSPGGLGPAAREPHLHAASVWPARAVQ
jgi:hypothetical protein